jgi:hypothetical protein
MGRQNPVTRIVMNRTLFRLAMSAAVALGVTGITFETSSKPSELSVAPNLRKASVIIFLVLTILLAVQLLLLAKEEAGKRPSTTSCYTPPFLNQSLEEGGPGNRRKEGEPIGKSFGLFITFLIVALLIAREAFFTATINKPAKQQNEDFFYPLAVVTEFIAVCLFAVPGLVPTGNEELPR